MEVINRTTTTMSSSSSLNPNAPLFIPRAYQVVEDFSDEWWELVQSSPWFSDYWLQECFQDPQNAPLDDDDVDDLLPNIDSIFDGYSITKQEEEKENCRDLVSLGGLKWRKSSKSTPKYLFEKAPKIVNLKVNPRPIQQPR